MLLALIANVIRLRFKHQVGLGDGGEDELIKAIRMHGNFIETVPLALILMLLLEIQVAMPAILHGLGLFLVIGRAAHAYALYQTDGTSYARVAGTLMTVTVIGLASFLCLLRGFGLQF